MPQSRMSTLFGEEPTWYKKEELPFSDRWRICPWDVDFKIEDNWMPILKKYPNYFKELPTEIKYVEKKENEEFVIWGIVYDKNLKNHIEEAQSRGKPAPADAFAVPQDFCNFVLEDDSDFITVRVSKYVFPQYKKLIFERLRDDDVILIRGKMGSGIRMFFANKILSLREFEERQKEIKDTLPSTSQ